MIAALAGSGHTVQPFKVGPDYIDPGHLSAASGREAINLDVWLMGRGGVLNSFVRNSGPGISLVEGVMGYYDGAGSSGVSSTHHVSSILGAPVVLVLDASRAGRSVAATALGFMRFRRNHCIRGIILNRLGSKRHEKICRDALEPLGVPVVGCIPRDARFSLPSRHLGLVPAIESRPGAISAVARGIAPFVDAAALARIARTAGPLPRSKRTMPRKKRAVIAVALDSSFNFYYKENLESLRRSGAELVFFSPSSGGRLPPCDGLYMGGGFPEVRGAGLEKNARMRSAVKKFAEDGGPVYAECGGLMYLTRSISGESGEHKMAGLFDAHTHMTKKVKLGYTRCSTKKCLISAIPRKFHGHEFHYSEIRGLPRDSKFAYTLLAGSGIRDGMDGLTVYNTLASYGHVFFDNAMADRLVDSCASYSRS
ncbi:cobyrinic acid a,c-diamide synthase [Cenarchaeum symbiosum A]|uniref:Cobyrinic acid a,c-diamide synthase n=1 Tax=Cenarchaeum symbiosum (strain A) TaxID=414004 RepID=A0RYY5_CENSY|nr:cobyrinic acid a,c-diamide synthase [Cenarchaeum symbiosum A]